MSSDHPPDVVVKGGRDGFLQRISSGRHSFEADEPLDVGGTDKAPTPYDYLLAALGACTSMTIGVYARTKKWPLEEIRIELWHSRIHARDCADCETTEGMLDQVRIRIDLSGALSDEQRSKLMQIAAKCPVHRTLKSEIAIRIG